MDRIFVHFGEFHVNEEFFFFFFFLIYDRNSNLNSHTHIFEDPRD